MARARTFAVFLALLPALFLALGCSGAADLDDPDVQFSMEMIPHHRQTIELANLVPGRSTDPYVTGLARQIKIDQANEIDMMSTWLQNWGLPLPPANAARQLPGMLSNVEISALKSRKGREFDRIWLTTLAKHLGNSVTMAQVVLATGDHPPTTGLARRVVDKEHEQLAEIDRHLA
ncbi:DUF305 domain-containing protein [Acrocarpospora catenulata]|uniref:DUF305 domain-containing protein n=1 Tax=Acrocarpospora catenulata TaxID=2836182 RepID=UPI001BD99C1D|nr:DUF305 domain-containing protein [Acrocarpospora catenulata]